MSALIQINFLAGSRIDPSSVAWIDFVLISPGVATLQVSCLISVLLIEVCQDNSDVPCSIRTAAQTHELTTPSQTSSRRPPTPRPLCRDPTLMLPSDTVRSGRAHPPRPAPPAGFSAARQRRRGQPCCPHRRRRCQRHGLPAGRCRIGVPTWRTGPSRRVSEKQMVLGTANLTVKMAIGSQHSPTVSEGDL